MEEWKKYRRISLAEIRPFKEGEIINPAQVAIAPEDMIKGSPKPGDVIARNPDNHNDQWLINAEYFAKYFEPVE